MKINKKIAITGSSGFIGSALVKRLLNNNFDVIKIDLEKNLDITNINDLSNIPKFDILIHLAAKIYVPLSFKNPRDFYHTNIIGTLNALELCKKYNAKMILASSYIYGYPKYLPIDENHAIEAVNPYSQSKIMCEQLCEGYNRDFGVPILILRPFNIYGIHQSKDFLIPSIIHQIKKRKVVINNLRPKRDFIYLDDMVDAYISAISYDNNNFDVFNICDGRSFSVQEIIDIIRKFSPNSFEVVDIGESRKNEIWDLYGDNSKAKKLLNWAPKMDLTDGLKIIMAQEFNFKNKL